MKISKKLLNTIAASVILGGAIVSCEKAEISVDPKAACEIDCDIDHNHNEVSENTNSHAASCPACGMG